MLRTVPLSIIRSFSLYTKQWYTCMSYRFADSLRAGSCSQTVSKSVWLVPLLCVQWKTPDYGQRNRPKHTEFYSKNKFEKLVHLVGFIRRMLQRHIQRAVRRYCKYIYTHTHTHKNTHTHTHTHTHTLTVYNTSSMCSVSKIIRINLLKPTGNFTYHQV